MFLRAQVATILHCTIPPGIRDLNVFYASGTACRPRNWIRIDLYSVSYEKGKLQQGRVRKRKALAPNHTCQKIRLWESSYSEIVVIIHYSFQPISR